MTLQTTTSSLTFCFWNQCRKIYIHFTKVHTVDLIKLELYVAHRGSKGPASTMDFNVAKIASARASSTISLRKSLRVAGPLIDN